MTILRKLIDQNFEMHSGDSKDIRVSVLDELDAVVDITGATAVFILSKNPYSAAIVTKSSGSGIVITNGPGGILTVSLDPADTDALLGSFYYEIELTDALLKVSTIVVGQINIRADVVP